MAAKHSGSRQDRLMISESLASCARNARVTIATSGSLVSSPAFRSVGGHPSFADRPEAVRPIHTAGPGTVLAATAPRANRGQIDAWGSQRVVQPRPAAENRSHQQTADATDCSKRDTDGQPVSRAGARSAVRVRCTSGAAGWLHHAPQRALAAFSQSAGRIGTPGVSVQHLWATLEAERRRAAEAAQAKLRPRIQRDETDRSVTESTCRDR